MEGSHPALVDRIRIGSMFHQSMDDIDLVTVVRSTSGGSAIACIVKWLSTAAVSGRHLCSARKQLSNHGREIGGRRYVESCVAGIRIMSYTLEEERF
jgi:hypothetical protein